MTDKQKYWHVLEIRSRSEADAAVEFALNELDALGTEINNLGKDRPFNVVVNGYFNEPLDDQIVTDQLSASLRIHELPGNSIESFAWHMIENHDWLAEWKKHWKPTEIGRFIIAPPWSEVVGGDKIVIRIEPNMAFGTGTHETTQLCLSAIGKIYRPEQSFLDMGTGTGILAIAAAKLGGTSILACDTDCDSVKIARENAEANDVGERIMFSDGPVDETTAAHDFVAANLTIDVILPILPLLVSKAKKVLVLSGILADQKPMIVDGLTDLEMTNFRIDRAGEWISVRVTL